MSDGFWGFLSNSDNQATLGWIGAGIAAVFMLQGIVIGVVGTVLGLSLGSGLAYWLRLTGMPSSAAKARPCKIALDTKANTSAAHLLELMKSS